MTFNFGYITDFLLSWFPDGSSGVIGDSLSLVKSIYLGVICLGGIVFIGSFVKKLWDFLPFS